MKRKENGSFERALKKTLNELEKDSWGRWYLDKEHSTLVFCLEPGNDVYDVPLDRIKTTVGLLEIVRQVHEKSFITNEDFRNFFRALYKIGII